MTKEEEKEDYEVFLECQEDHQKDIDKFEFYLLEKHPCTFDNIYNAEIVNKPINENYFTSKEQSSIFLRYFNPTILEELIREYTKEDNKRNEPKYDTQMKWIKATKQNIEQLGGDSNDWVFQYYRPTITEWLADRAENLVNELSKANLGRKKISELKSYMKNVKNTLNLEN